MAILNDILSNLVPIGVAAAVVAIREFGAIKQIKEVEKVIQAMDQTNKEEHQQVFVSLDNITGNVERNKEVLDRYQNNEAFYNSINNTIAEASRFLQDKGPQRFLVSFGDAVIKFSKIILNTNTDDYNYTLVNSNYETLHESLLECAINILGKDMTNIYLCNILVIMDRYYDEITIMLDDIVNDKKKRFRTETMRLMEKATVEYVQRYSEYIKTKKGVD